MRTRTWCVAAASALSAQVARGPDRSLRGRRSRASVGRQPSRSRDSRGRRCRAGGRARGRPLAESTLHVQECAVAGVTENMFLVTQALPVTGRRSLDVDAATALVAASERRADQDVRQVRAALRSAYADLVSAQVREAEIARARDRLRGLTDSRGARAPATRPATTVFAPSGRRWISTPNGRRLEPSVRGRKPGWPASSPPRAKSTSFTAVVPRPAARPALPGADALVAHAETTLPELAALRQEIASAEFAAQAAGRIPIPEPEIVAGTKCSTSPAEISAVFSAFTSRSRCSIGRSRRARRRRRAAFKPRHASRRSNRCCARR